MFMNIRSPKVYDDRFDRYNIKGERYRQLFRFDKENVAWLAERFLTDKRETRGGALQTVQKMEMTLRYLADPGYQTSEAKIMGVTQPTVSTTIKDTLQCIAEEGPIWIHFPSNLDEIEAAKECWAKELGRINRRVDG